MINGGNIYCYASGNDAIDSNGTITINGGQVLSCGATSPEEGFDCDQNTFLINGGVLVGLGGSTSTPSSSSAQCAAVYSGASGSQGTVYSVCASDGSHVLSVTIPRQYSSMTMLLSCTILADNDVPGLTIKLTDAADDDNYFFADRHEITADKAFVYKVTGARLPIGDAAALSLFFDFGGTPSGTNVKISDIILIKE